MAEKKFLDYTGLTYLVGKLNEKIAAKSDSGHKHSGSDITSGTVDAARLPKASETASGIVTTSSQTLNGSKTFQSKIVAEDGVSSGANISPNAHSSFDLGNMSNAWRNVIARKFNLIGSDKKEYGGLNVDTEGTADDGGLVTLVLGAAKAEGTVGNAKGKIKLYGTGTGYTELYSGYNGDSFKRIYLPSDPGTLALKSEIPVTSSGTVTSGNADYAEIGEWADGNPSVENRIGYFVAVDPSTAGTTMVKATSTMDVRGVTVSSPAFSGNYTWDKFADDTGEMLPAYDFVAVMGLVSVIDNGTCTINGRCMPADDGTAVPSSNNMGYQVIDRIDSTHILIAVEPGADMLKRVKDDVVTLQNHAANKSNPHSVTKSQVGLGNVDNTSDANKPVSTAQATAIADAKKAGTDAQSSLSSHSGNKSNPHGVTKAQVGLGNVPNVATNDQTPTYTAASSLATLTSGEKLSVSMGKIMKAITDLISHIGNKSNPHNVTAAQVGALPLTGGSLTGNLTGQYLTGTWLQVTADNHLSSASAKIAVLDSSGWVYYRTIDELLADLGIPDATTIRATTSVYGTTKLSTSVTSTSKTTAATPYAVKTALDKAKAYCDDAILTAINTSY